MNCFDAIFRQATKSVDADEEDSILVVARAI